MVGNDQARCSLNNLASGTVTFLFSDIKEALQLPLTLLQPDTEKTQYHFFGRDSSINRPFERCHLVLQPDITPIIQEGIA